MSTRLTVISSMLALWVTGARAAEVAPPYYLALGDSFALGVQPTSQGDAETSEGYADDLHAYYRLRAPGLRLVKLGCARETTTTMISGAACSYPSGSQLAEAVDFLQTHRVALVTLDIGANNILPCISLGGIDQNCVRNGINAALWVDLPQILVTLRAAA
jgi:lysophospholipase L1-like esterase